MAGLFDEITTIHQIKQSLATVKQEPTMDSRLQKFGELIMQKRIKTAANLLPLLFNLRGEPLTLDSHPPMEELLSLDMPSTSTLMLARQTGKSSTIAQKIIMLCVSIPHFSVLSVTPLFEHIRRFSNSYVQPLIQESPVRSLWVGQNTVNSVLHKTFKNGSQLLFSYAFLDVTRIRGISAKMLTLDEAQSLDSRWVPIIRECMAFFAEYGVELWAGTPLTNDNLLTGMHRLGSQAEWFIPCTHCTTGGYPTWNIPSKEWHAEKMIGPYHDSISEKYPGTICHKCGKPISPRLGHWRHRYPNRMWSNASYHIPQIILPFHYSYPTKWMDICEKRLGKKNTTATSFWNEVMGEPYDHSSKLVSETELRRASILGRCHPESGRKYKSNWRMSCLGIDWGGGGEQGVSFTTIAFMGIDFAGKIQVPWGIRLLTPHDHIQEADDVLAFYRYFVPDIVAHDYTGAGSLRETIMVQAGVPLQKIMPLMYIRSASGAPCRPVPATEMHPRNHYRVDKSRSLLLTCGMIRQRKIEFFDYDNISREEPGLIADFLALVEDKVKTGSAGEIYRIDRAQGFSDDFAQAVNIGAVALWYKTKQWPDFLSEIPRGITPEQAELADPESPNWS